jgi:hypothetical protein
MIDFLQTLQRNIPPVTIFSDDYFRSVAGIPFLFLQKQHKSFVAKVLIAEQFYSYQYPFVLPPSFLSYRTSYELHFNLFRL